jgi:hypothetical protein
MTNESQLAVCYGFLLLPSGLPIDLDGSAVAGRLARLLIDVHRIAPGLRVEVEEIAAALWPDCAVDDKARIRVKVAVCRLRARGLPILTMGERLRPRPAHPLDRARRDGQPYSPNDFSFLCSPSRVMPRFFAAAVLLFWCSRSASINSHRST